MTVTQLTAADIELTKLQEGLVLHRYYDPYGQIYTIGYGTTSGAGVVEPIPEYCTEAQATAWLLEYMNRDVVPAILQVFQPANGNELGGLADLGYNAGAGVFREEPMYSALKSGNRAAIGEAFMAYDRAATGVLDVLIHRRESDRALFLREAAMPPTYRYDLYPAAMRTTVERYDVLRQLEHAGKLTRKEGLWLIARRAQCKVDARSIARNAIKRHPLKDGKPSWSVDHRGWLYRELSMRGAGKRVLPSA
jgi:GH24 family phage-related lysozyme (muramidase)